MSDLSIQNSNLQSQKTCGCTHNENPNDEMNEVNIWNGQMRLPGSVISEVMGHKIVDNICNPKPFGLAIGFGEKLAELILKKGESEENYQIPNFAEKELQRISEPGNI